MPCTVFSTVDAQKQRAHSIFVEQWVAMKDVTVAPFANLSHETER
jgi:hypothetical protein